MQWSKATANTTRNQILRQVQVVEIPRLEQIPTPTYDWNLRIHGFATPDGKERWCVVLALGPFVWGLDCDGDVELMAICPDEARAQRIASMINTQHEIIAQVKTATNRPVWT